MNAAPRTARTSRTARGGTRGQATVETAIVLPTILFLILGTIQFFVIEHARMTAQFAVQRAVRVGVVRHGECRGMLEAAIANLLPTITRILSASTPGSAPWDKLTNAFMARRGNEFLWTDVKEGATSPTGSGDAIVWIDPSLDRGITPATNGAVDEEEFDDPESGTDKGAYVMSARMTYFFPLRFPFVNRILTRTWMASNSASKVFNGPNPLMKFQAANWTNTTSAPSDLVDEVSLRFGKQHYVLPIVVTASMRMFSPPRPQNFAGRCE